MMPTVFIMARAKAHSLFLAICCLSFVRLFLRTPQFHQSPSHSSGPHSDTMQPITFSQIPLGWNSPYTEPYPILPGILAVCTSYSGQRAPQTLHCVLQKASTVSGTL